MTPDDKNDRTQKLKNGDLAFFGAVTASVSHELNNIVSIIDQSAGLLTDLLAGAQSGRSLSPEQLGRIADRIKHQTSRGVDFIRRLNAFAHSTDEPVREFELNQLVENLVALTVRFANLKGVNLKVAYSDQPLNIITSPFLIQQVLYLIIKNILDRALKNDDITLSIERHDRTQASLVITSAARGEPEPQKVAEWKALVGIIEGEFFVKIQGEKIIFEILVTGVRT